jgi:hypothetical protein
MISEFVWHAYCFFRQGRGGAPRVECHKEKFMKKQTSVLVMLATIALLALGFSVAKNGADDPAGDPRGDGKEHPAGHARIMKTSSDNLLAKKGADDPTPRGEPIGHA